MSKAKAIKLVFSARFVVKNLFFALTKKLLKKTTELLFSFASYTQASLEWPKRAKKKFIINRKFNQAQACIAKDLLPSKTYIYSQSNSIDKCNPLISIIILNKDGKNDLKHCIDSLIKYHPNDNYEIIIVDHSSKDGSQKMISNYMKSAPIRLMAYGANNSFSYANNCASNIAKGEFLLFCNNDIIFTEPVLDKLIECFNQQHIGLAGFTLFYGEYGNGASIDIQHNGVSFKRDNTYDFWRPHNIKSTWKEDKINCLAVTAALMGCRTEDFKQINGFEETYFYGYEDVDICLKMTNMLSKSITIVPRASAIHNESKTQKNNSSKDIYTRRMNNIKVFKDNWEAYLNTALFKERFISRDSVQISIGIIVSDNNPLTAFGDYFTAKELAESLTNIGCTVKLLSIKSIRKDCYNMDGLDCVISLLDTYKIDKIYNKKTNLIKIAWPRNWFERWISYDHFLDYDIVLASSQYACNYIEKQTGVKVHLFHLATNHLRFTIDPSLKNQNYESDYCFTGSYWKSKRDIEKLNPNNLPYTFKLFGHGWKKHPAFKNYWFGLVQYLELPKIYASTKILIDDANHVTKSWGSVNSRVFDGIASGALVITNSQKSSDEIFMGRLPVYKNVKELYEMIDYYLTHDDERIELTKQLKEIILERHTYQIRAEQLINILTEYITCPKRLAIKMPVPKHQLCQQWGDFHLAYGLAKELREQGWIIRLDPISHWYKTYAVSESINLLIRGLSKYKINPNQTNIIWIISHPEKTSSVELKSYDHILVASHSYATELENQFGDKKVTLMLQCTDPRRFKCKDDDDVIPAILFVGNSRKVMRPIVQHAIDAELDLHVYGADWESLIPSKYIKGEHIDNSILSEYYSKYSILLNDHWDTMKKYGFISNRLFDAVAAGATTISDNVQGINKVFGDAVYVYDGTALGLRKQIELALKQKKEYNIQKQIYSQKVINEHSFKKRAYALISIVESLQ